MDNVLTMVGLALRAGRLAVGAAPVGTACGASDAADNTVRRAARFAQAGQCLTASLPCSREELGAAVGRGSCAMAAVTDTGLAGAIAQRLAQRDPERYGELARRLEVMARRADQRRQEQRSRDRKPRGAK